MAEQLSLDKDYMALASFLKARGMFSSPHIAVVCFEPCKADHTTCLHTSSSGRLLDRVEMVLMSHSVSPYHL